MTALITTSTPIRYVEMAFSAHKRPNEVYIQTDETPTRRDFYFYFSENAIQEGTDLWDTFEVLRTIYNSPAGFRDASNNAVEIFLDQLPEWVGGLDGFFEHGYFNPLAIEVVGAGQGVTSIGARTYRAFLWQRADTLPSDPPADWYDPNSTGIITTGLGLWRRTRGEAEFVSTTGPFWFAIGTVAINDNGNRVYQPWEVLQEFGVEYSADGVTWRTTQEAGDRYFGFLSPDGTRRVVEIAEPPDLSWTELYEGTPYLSPNTDIANADLGQSINFELYRRLRFTFEPFGNWGSDATRQNRGGQCVAHVDRPIDGWEGSETEAPGDATGTATWMFDEVAGASVVFHESGSRNRQTLPAAVTRSGDLPAVALAGKFTLIAESSNAQNMIFRLRFHDFVANSVYERFHLTIDGATY